MASDPIPSTLISCFALLCFALLCFALLCFALLCSLRSSLRLLFTACWIHRTMLDHVSITVADIGAPEVFYDAIMAALGVPKVRRSENRLGYAERCDSQHPDRSYLSIKLGHKPEPSYGRHWCFKAPNRSAVDAFWEAGIA